MSRISEVMPTNRRNFMASTGIAFATGFGTQSVAADKKAAATSFEDVPRTHWAYPQITALAENGFISGYGGKFFPEEPITRGQLAVLLVRVYNLDEPRGISRFSADVSTLFGELFATGSEESAFEDIEDHWAREEIELAVEAGFMGAYDTDGDGTAISNKFKPSEPVTRLELILLLQNDFQFSERYAVGTEFPLTEAYLSGFKGRGITSVEGTDRDGIARMMDAGKLRNDQKLFHTPGETELKPGYAATRAQAVNLLYNMRPNYLSGGKHESPVEEVDYLKRGDVVRDDRLLIGLSLNPWRGSPAVGGNSNATEATVIDIQERVSEEHGTEYWLFVNTEDNVSGWLRYTQDLDVKTGGLGSDQPIVATDADERFDGTIGVTTQFEEGPGVDVTEVPAGTEGVVTGPKREVAGLYNGTELLYEVLFYDVDGQDVNGFVDPTFITQPGQN
jgi:hypothetical protein